MAKAKKAAKNKYQRQHQRDGGINGIEISVISKSSMAAWQVTSKAWHQQRKAKK